MGSIEGHVSRQPTQFTSQRRQRVSNAAPPASLKHSSEHTDLDKRTRPGCRNRLLHGVKKGTRLVDARKSITALTLQRPVSPSSASRSAVLLGWSTVCTTNRASLVTFLRQAFCKLRLQESGDDEYKSDQSASEDEVDSDFDIDEGAEPDSDQEESEPKRKRRVITKAYKEPLKAAKPNPKARKAWAQPSGSEKVKEEKREPFELQGDVGENRKSVRQSTTEHTRLTYLRLQERQVQPRRRKGPHHDRPLTQEELLAEAKITAEINLRSLENYERLEADKKKQVHKKRRCDGPTVRFHSVLTPLVSETHLKEETVDVEGLDQDPQQQPTPPSTASQDPPQPPTGQCARTFITFSDEETFESFFPRPRAHRPPVREICPVTHKPALYRDPITDIPYSNIRAFKIIREAYRKYVTAHGLPNTAAGGLGSPGDPNSRGTRQKIIIKQRMSAT